LQKIHIPDQRPVILDGKKLRMRPITLSSAIGNTTYEMASEYSQNCKEDALAKLKRVILNDGESAHVTDKRECDIFAIHTPDCLADKGKEFEE